MVAIEENAGHRIFNEGTGFFLSQERIIREKELGYWPDRVLTDYFEEAVTKKPDTAAIAVRHTDTDNETELSYRELNHLVTLVANRFKDLGINKGDVISFQLPNWWQFVAIHLACIKVGAVSNPLSPIFRARELEFMLGHSGTRLLIVPKVFRDFNYESLARKLQQALPSLQHLLVIDGEGEEDFSSIFKNNDELVAEMKTQLQPDDLMKIMFTSGTTGEPKGVMHTSNTLLTAVVQASRRFGLDKNEVLFMPSPFAHSIGFLYGLMMACYLGVKLVTMDKWDASMAANLVERHAVTYIFASTPFLLDLVNLPDLPEHNLESLRLFVTSGAPVPPVLVSQARESLNVKIITGWGMTETGLITSTLPTMEDEGIGTDGKPIPCSQVRIVDSEGSEQVRGKVGSLQCRGSTTFPGYFKRPGLYTVDDSGWFDSGDLATMNEAGYISIAGRAKDIIIRGGVNIPVVEVEALIYTMPQVREVALVGMPDTRLGEKACAFVVLHNGKSMSFREMTDYLAGKELAKQYLPERLEIIPELPKTPSGKLQKFILRDMARKFVNSA